MDNNYGKRAPFTLGVEEEFQLLDAESFELVSRFDEIAAEADDERVKPELLQSVLEVATGVARTVGEAVEESAELRRRVRDAAAERGALIASAGTHPFSRWEHQEVTESERYEQIVDALQSVAEREVIFGLHVHVGLESGQQAIAVTNALRTWVPELLALSANSPFWHGRDTGLASTRSKIFDAMPRSGLPPAFASFEQFEHVIGRAVKGGFVSDYTFLWWDLRPHPKLGTIELRACDAQSRIGSVAAIAALFQSLVATVAEAPPAPQPAPLIAENRWRAARHGLDCDLVDLERDTARPARDAVLELVELAAPAAKRLGCTAELAEVERICRRGTGAAEQRAVREETGSLLDVTRRLVELTNAGL